MKIMEIMKIMKIMELWKLWNYGIMDCVSQGFHNYYENYGIMDLCLQGNSIIFMKIMELWICASKEIP